MWFLPVDDAYQVEIFIGIMFGTPICILQYLCILLGFFLKKLTVFLSVKEFLALKYPEDSTLCSQGSLAGLSIALHDSSHHVILFP